MVITVPVAVTDEELERITNANPGWRVEYVDGAVEMSPPTNFDAGYRNARLCAVMQAWATSHGYIAADSSTGFKVDEKNTLSPDCALLHRDRWEALTAAQRRTFGPTPDVVFELISSPEEANPDHRKCERWLSYGVSYVVALNPTGKPKVRTWGTPPDDFPTDWSSIVD